MTEGSKIGFTEAAQTLGVPIRALRQAIRDGRIAAPEGAKLTAISEFSAEWLANVRATVKPSALNYRTHSEVAPFARYDGTSAWRKYHRRVREYSRFQAATA